MKTVKMTKRYIFIKREMTTKTSAKKKKKKQEEKTRDGNLQKKKKRAGRENEQTNHCVISETNQLIRTGCWNVNTKLTRMARM